MQVALITAVQVLHSSAGKLTCNVVRQCVQTAEGNIYSMKVLSTCIIVITLSHINATQKKKKKLALATVCCLCLIGSSLQSSQNAKPFFISFNIGKRVQLAYFPGVSNSAREVCR